MECKTEFKQSFQPVTFTITCQTPEDLVAIWQRFNLAPNTVVSAADIAYPKLSGRGSDCTEAWKQVDNVVKQLGWR